MSIMIFSHEQEKLEDSIEKLKKQSITNVKVFNLEFDDFSKSQKKLMKQKQISYNSDDVMLIDKDFYVLNPDLNIKYKRGFTKNKFLSSPILWSIFHFIMFFYALPIISLVVSIPFIILSSNENMYIQITLLVTTFMQIIYFLVFALTKFRYRFVNDFKQINWHFFLKLITYLIISFCLTIYSNVLVSLLTSYFPTYSDFEVENQKSVIDIITNINPLVTFLMICVSAPLFEEFIFRMVLIDEFLGFVPSKNLKIIISTIVFILIHLSNGFGGTLIGFIIGALGYFSVSFTMSLCYVRENNILLTILIHFINNFNAFFAIMFLSKLGEL